MSDLLKSIEIDIRNEIENEFNLKYSKILENKENSKFDIDLIKN